MLRRIQERFGAGALPVIVFSGQVDERAVDEASRSGARGFLGKPFDPQRLIDQAKQILPT
jgi:FixJ family two-component response regulator